MEQLGQMKKGVTRASLQSLAAGLRNAAGLIEEPSEAAAAAVSSTSQWVPRPPSMQAISDTFANSLVRAIAPYAAAAAALGLSLSALRHTVLSAHLPLLSHHLLLMFSLMLTNSRT